MSSLTRYSIVHASADMIQDYFDELQVLDRVTAGEILLYWKKWKPVNDHVVKGLPPHLTEVVLRYLWPDALIQFESHHYCTPGGQIWGTGLIDPKMMRYADEFLFNLRT